MSSMNRLAIINEAILRAGRQSQALNLVNAYDAILVDISTRFSILGHQCASNNMTANNSLISLPTNYRTWEMMKVGNNANSLVEIDYEDEEDFIKHNLLDTASLPDKFTIIEADSVIKTRPIPTSNCAYEFWYSEQSPKSGNNNNYVHTLGERFDETIIYGVTAKACELIQEYKRASYWGEMYERDLLSKASLTLRSPGRVKYNDF